MSVPAEILKKVKLLEIRTRKIVNNVFAGEYHTVFKGQGMTFAEFREYVPGDDVRSISWTLTARTGKPYIKKYDEERELSVILAVDISGSTDFGSGDYFKGEVMAHVSALLAFSAVKNKDQVGLLLFSDQVEHFVPPGKGRGHVHRILRDLYYFKPQHQKTDLRAALAHLTGVMKKRATIFVISDFIAEGYDQMLRQLGRKHDVIALVVRDRLERELPDLGVVDFQDAETGEIVTVDTSSPSFRQTFESATKRRAEERDRLLRNSQVDRVDLDASNSFVDPLIEYFRRRKTRS
ncbi:MAG: DUF58 domain-containing protein [Bdellovibrionaceae bacterium]|nr:DUF58 domain-containing protein [Pseudobdellovibrionaceae bacterium]